MATIRPFKGVRPSEESASSIAALPYDVYTRQEAKAYVEQHPRSFLKIDRAETQFPDNMDMYSQPVYEKARDTLNSMIADGSFIKDDTDCYYIYALTMDGRTQTGVVGCASIDDYLENKIKKHENTREDKELDRIHHVDICSAQTGPIFLAYRRNEALRRILETITAQDTLYDFTSDDNVRHQVWKISEQKSVEDIRSIFSGIDSIYIADGHHRAASAVKVGLKRRREHPDYDGSEEFNYFLSVLFPAQELHIFDYNRVVYGLADYDFDTLLDMIQAAFDVTEMGKEPFRPQCKGEIGLYGKGNWYCLDARQSLYSEDPVSSLDVSILQQVILDPLLGIQDPKTDPRIHFVGGIRGLDVLARMADAKEDAIAFAMYPTSMEELLAVADAGLLMPPKSTWFEPKLRSGLFIHQI